MRFTVDTLIYTIPALLISLTLHELAHGYAAYKFGDFTAKHDGRLSLNPLRHIDPIGTISLLVFGFGWAKPVKVDPDNFKNPKDAMVWTAFAGPLMNFALSFVCVLLATFIMKVFNINTQIMLYIYVLLQTIAMMSMGLGIFNLLPIPPMDGSKILYGLLPDHIYFKLLQYEQMLSIFLILILFSGLLDNPLYQTRGVFMEALQSLSNIIISF